MTLTILSGSRPGRLLSAAVVLGIALATAAPAGAASAVRSYKDLKFDPINWKKPVPETLTLKNGATVYLLEDHRLPIVNFYGVVRTGSLYDPPGKYGTANLTGTLLRTGGTRKHGWADLDREVDRIGMSVSTAAQTDLGNASFEVLTENFEPALSLLFEMLREPAFDPDKLALAKDKIKEQIRRQNDNPIQIAIREMRPILFGADNPRGFTPTFKSVDAITRQDLIDFHARYYCPANMTLGVVGDFDRAKVVGQIEKAMGEWPSHPVTWPEVKPLDTARPGGIYLADKATATQSTIIVARLTVKQGQPDQYPLEVLDNVLGSGGFSSRVVKSVRNDRGLAYAAGSALQVGYLDAGPEIVYAVSKGESTVEAARVMLDEIARIRKEPVPPEELNKGKSSILNGAVFDYDRPEKVLSETIDLAYYGLPQDQPEKRLKALEAVSSADVQRVAGQYFPDDRLNLLVVGPVAKFDKPLSTIGTFQTIELKDPTAQ